MKNRFFPLAQLPQSSHAKAFERGKSTFKIILIMSIIGAVLPFGLPTLLICAGLIPTVVVLFTDTDPDKSSTATIGFMNLAGVLPYLVDLWEKGQSMAVAIKIMKDPQTWIVMLGLAGIGQLLLFIIPPMVASLTISRLESRLNALKDGLEQLRTIWGPEVATNMPIDQVRKQAK